MSIQIVTQFRARPGRSAELLGLLLNLMPREHRPEGCLDVTVHRNQDDAHDIVTEQCWQSRQQAERWRANPQALTAIRGMIAEPMLVRCFEAVEAGVDSRGQSPVLASRPQDAREIPKVSTPDALGG